MTRSLSHRKTSCLTFTFTVPDISGASRDSGRVNDSGGIPLKELLHDNQNSTNPASIRLEKSRQYSSFATIGPRILPRNDRCGFLDRHVSLERFTNGLRTARRRSLLRARRASEGMVSGNALAGASGSKEGPCRLYCRVDSIPGRLTILRRSPDGAGSYKRRAQGALVGGGSAPRLYATQTRSALAHHV